MLNQLLTIARNTFVESVRQPVLLLLVLACALLQVFNTWTAAFSMGRSSTAEVSADNKLLLDIGLATIFGCGVLMASFLATAVVSSEIERRTMLTVISKPIPRAVVVAGKYIGVAGAITGAVVIMLAFLMLAIRHGVLSTAGDHLDQPVLLFGFGAVFASLLLAAAANYMYGWSFNQTAMTTLLPLIVLAYVAVLLFSKRWELQSPMVDLKPKILVACGAMALAILVLTAVATAASTRLGQVMTIITCAAVFFGGLLSNHFLGRQAYQNDVLGVIASAEPASTADEGLGSRGATYTITLTDLPRQRVPAGSSFFYGANPNGFSLASGTFAPFEGDASETAALFRPETPPGLVVVESDGTTLVVRNVGREPQAVARAPRSDDYVFMRPTRVNPLVAGLWAVVPNMHYFWLLDAVTQNRAVPVTHFAMIVVYASLQIAAFLALAVALFQRRDVG
ncbi:MAG: ABC transporter permease [Planctomycetota bacterium]